MGPAGVEQMVPNRWDGIGGSDNFEPVLSRVARPVHHAVDAVDRLLGEREGSGVRQTEPLDRTGALHREQRVFLGDVAHVRTGDLPFLQPFEVGAPVRGVDDQQVPEVVEPVHDEVVDDPAVLVRQERVLRLARADPLDIVRQRRLEKLRRARTFDLELSHVRHVEDAAIGAHRLVLRDDALVLDGHLPAGEGNHPRAELDVGIVKRRALQRLSHAPRC